MKESLCVLKEVWTSVKSYTLTPLSWAGPDLVLFTLIKQSWLEWNVLTRKWAHISKGNGLRLHAAVVSYGILVDDNRIPSPPFSSILFFLQKDSWEERMLNILTLWIYWLYTASIYCRTIYFHDKYIFRLFWILFCLNLSLHIAYKEPITQTSTFSGSLN